MAVSSRTSVTSTIGGTFLGGGIPYQTVFNAVVSGQTVQGFNYAATVNVTAAPIPEPSAAILGLSGLALLVGVRFAQRNQTTAQGGIQAWKSTADTPRRMVLTNTEYVAFQTVRKAA